jgi:hypothetical protein
MQQQNSGKVRLRPDLQGLARGDLVRRQANVFRLKG